MKPMQPLLLADFTATSCIGTGVAPTLASLMAQTQRPEALRVRNRQDRYPYRRSPGRRCTAAAGAAANIRLPQQSSGRACPAARWLLGCRGGRGRALGPAPGRGVYRHQHRGHHADGTGVPRARSAQRRAAGSVRIRHHPQLLLGRGLRSAALPPRRAGRGRFLGLRIERQGVRLRETHDRGGTHRCGAGRRNGFALPHHFVWIPFAAAIFARTLPSF